MEVIAKGDLKSEKGYCATSFLYPQIKLKIQLAASLEPISIANFANGVLGYPTNKSVVYRASPKTKIGRGVLTATENTKSQNSNRQNEHHTKLVIFCTFM